MIFWCAGLFLVGAVAAGEGELMVIQAMVEEGRLAPALERLQGYRAVHPDEPQARFLEGLILVKQGDNEQAIEVFTRLARDYPELPEPHNNIAVLYAADGRYEEARDALLEAISTHPSYATAQENLGDIYAKMAAMAYDKVLVIDERNRGAQAKLALINDLFSAGKSEGHAGKTASMVDHKRTERTFQTVAAAPKSRPVQEGGEPGVLVAVQNWASAWSAKDVSGYLSFYAKDFRPQRGISRSAWQAQRRLRLAKPRFIEIRVQDPQVISQDNGRVRVSFVQTYRSDTYSDRTHKALTMIQTNGKWKILREEAVR